MLDYLPRQWTLLFRTRDKEAWVIFDHCGNGQVSFFVTDDWCLDRFEIEEELVMQFDLNVTTMSEWFPDGREGRYLASFRCESIFVKKHNP